MFNKKSSRHSLALFVALALGSGALLAPSAAGAADVSGQNVEIDDAHAPSDNAIAPGGGPAFGTAAGFIKEEANSGNVTGNTLTFKNINYMKQLYGGLTFGTGNVTGNKVFVNPATGTFFSNTDGIFGGNANGGGNVEYNHAEFNGNQLNGDLVGGMTKGTGTGIVKGNTALLKGGNANNIYGGMSMGGANGDVIGNTATIEGGTITGTGNVYGGYTDGTGKVTGNTARVTGGTAKDVYGGRSQSGDAEGNTAKVTGGSAQDVYGGRSQSGDTDGNSVEISGGTARTIYGGYSSGTGKATNNTVTLTGGTLNSDIYGGVASSGAAMNNTVNIKGGSAANHDVYGGFSTHGDATGNTVNITGGSVRNVDGGRSLNGHATNNIVNIGCAEAGFSGSITGIINGGSGTTYGKDYRTGNKLNVYGNASAANIRSFAKINFHFNAHVNQSASFLTLTDGGGTTIESLGDLNVDGEHGRKGVLLQNTPGSITITDGQNRRIKTSDDKELILEKSTDNKKITYEGYRFANATEPTTVTESGLTSTWGGRSVVGNSTCHNKITVGSGTHDNIYGGWTAGTGTTATDKDNSYKNEVTLDGSGATTDNLYGGYVDTDAGKAEENTVAIKNGTVNTAVYGGVANKVAGTGHVKKNEVNISGGTVSNVYGGYSAGSGDVLENEVTATGGTLNGNIHGGQSTTGAATGNIVTLKNVTVSGNVTGGEGAATNNNTVNLNGGANVTGALKGGSQANGTGNTLNIKGKDNRAGQIAGFQKMTFDATGVTQGDTMLRLTDGTAMNGVDKDMLKANGTSAGKVTLLENNAGINFTTAVAGDVLKSETNDTMEKSIGVERNGSQITKLTYEGYQFKGKHTTTSFTESGVTSTWGGRSKAGNTTTENTIVVANGTHTNIYGGWTTGSGSTAAADKQKNSTANKVKVNGSANVTGTVYGGFTSVAGGKAQNNEVTIEKNLTANVVGGEAKGEASGNTVTVKANAADITGGRSTGAASNNTVNLTNATVNSITGGEGATTNNNTVNLNGGANVTGALKGGSAANGTGNTLNVKGKDNKAGSISGFQKMNFDATDASTDAAMLRTTGATDVNWETLTVKNASASEKPLTLLENANGINISGRTGDAVKSELNADATMETNIDVRKTGSKVTAITYEGYTFKGATQATTYGADTWAGRSKAGNTTQDNKLTLDDASKTYANVYGGWTSGTGTKVAADKQNNSLNNTVNYTAGTVTGTLYGGYTAAGEASGNTVNLGTVTTAANIYGGFGAVTKNNTINLKGARVTGTVTGGSQANGTGNTLAVYKPSEVHDFAGIQNLHFYTDEMAANAATPMLKLGTATKDIRGLNIGVARSGAAPKLIKGDKILLMKTAGGALTTDAAIQNKVEGMQGVSRRYEYEIKQEATGELTATVTKAGFAEQAKSLVETRAGLAGFVNQGADYLVQDGLAAAQMSVSASTSDKGKNAQRKAAASDGAAYQLWAGAGANSMRAESGSYVDSKGWNLGVGWAREDVQKDGAKVLFSPFVEYGRGTYDSYLDDGTHGNGKISYIGAGILGKLTQKDGLWLEGSLRAGRSKSDYSANLGGTAASYDGSNTYYGAHLGAGKTFAIKEDSSIDAYARYFWSHQNSMTATLNTGDRYEFGSVNSQRLRLGFRYSLKDKTTGEFYAGLAWEHEFAGKAGATYQGDAAPSPSLKGSSTMLELGYRFMPKNSRVSYDLHLNGWQGQRKGITGGASVKWTF